MNLTEFIQVYYINPIVYDTEYNRVDTSTYGIILFISLFLVLWLLKKLEVKIDERFILAVSPYMFLGSILRVMEDAEIFEAPIRYIFISPLIYFLLFFICISALLASLLLFRRGVIRDYIPLFSLTGVVLIILSLGILLQTGDIEFVWVPPVVIGIALSISTALYLIGRSLDIIYLTSPVNFLVLSAQLIDASSSYIGIGRLGYIGKHVLENFLIELTGSAAVMFPLKLSVMIPTLYILDTFFSEEEDTDLKNILLLAVLMLGIGPGIRNTLRMTLGV
ncbi:MAG: DUF63 family protein [Halobacteriota archaeon]|nr:DUF63 family protein [Halobacteriota archaeon]